MDAWDTNFYLQLWRTAANQQILRMLKGWVAPAFVQEWDALFSIDKGTEPSSTYDRIVAKLKAAMLRLIQKCELLLSECMVVCVVNWVIIPNVIVVCARKVVEYNGD